eukprot:49272-Chlamydomonas_euryale.AAC.2
MPTPAHACPRASTPPPPPSPPTHTAHLGDDVVNRRLKRRWRLLRDVVGDLVQREADRELCRELCDREAGGLGRERRRARHARVHLNDDHVTVRGVDRHLHVGSAALDAHLPDDGDSSVAQALRAEAWVWGVGCVGRPAAHSPTRQIPRTHLES